MDVDPGRMWGAIRAGLTMNREKLAAAFNASTHEAEEIALDEIARDLADRVGQAESVAELRAQVSAAQDAVAKQSPAKRAALAGRFCVD